MSRLRLLAAPVLAALLLGSGLALPASGSAAAPGTVTWGVAPANDRLGNNRAHFTYTLAPGTRITDALAVVNRGSSTITLKVYASDAFTTSTGAIDLLPAAQRPVDIGSWITVRTGSLTLKPQQSAVIPFTLSVPANATPGDHSGGVVTSLVTAAGSSSVRVDRRLGSRIYLRVPGAVNPQLSVDGIQLTYHGKLNPAGSGSATLRYTVTNTGNVRISAHQSVWVAGPFGLLGRSTVLADLPELLPGSSLSRTAILSGVWPAIRLKATVSLQPAAADSQVPAAAGTVRSSATAWGWPWGQLAVLAVLAAAALGYRQLRRRRRHRVEAAISAAVTEALQQTGAQAGGS